jgi:hypothetical protein
MADRDLQELKQRISLVDLIGETVSLKKDGTGRFVGLCPFHSDHTPSLVVYEDTRTWKCFGCEKKGDCYDWVGQRDSVDFKEARDRLQARYGTPNPSTQYTETIFDITDYTGVLVAQHVRRDFGNGRKTFTWRRNGKETLGGLRTQDLPLFNMKAIVDGPPGADVILVEGEKAALSLAGRGFLALGTVCGAAVCPAEEVLQPLIGSGVYLWADNDAPGLAHMTQVAATLQRLGVKPLLIRWPEAPPKGDAADFKGDVSELLKGAVPFPSEESQLIVGENIEQRIKLPSGQTITVRAENVRKERTGIHGKITILLEGRAIAFDTFNVERSEERGRLAKAAIEQLPEELQGICPLAWLRSKLDAFTSELWEKAQERDKAEEEIPSGVTKPLVYMAEPYILRGGKTILYAPPGSGKSYTALLLAVSVDAGCSKLWNVLKAKVLFVNLERSRESVSRRLGMVNQALGLPITRPLLMLHRSGRTLADVADVLQRDVKQRGVQLVILDSISRAGAGDLVDNQTANTVTDTLSRICPSWLALAHSPRADATHAFGSVHFDAGADLAVQLTSETVNDTLGVGLKITKSNDVPPGPVRALAIEFGENSISVRQARPSEFGELTLTHKKSLSQEVRAFLQAEGEATATQISEKLGRNRTNVATLLSSEAFTKTRKEGKNQFYGLKETRLL